MARAARHAEGVVARKQVSQEQRLDDGGIGDRGEATVPDIGRCARSPADLDALAATQNGVVVKDEEVAGIGRAVVERLVLAVHVEGVAIAIGLDQVVTNLVAEIAIAGARDGMTVVVEGVALDQRVGVVVEHHAVAQPGALVVVNEIVVDVRAVRVVEQDRRVRPAGMSQ